MNTFTEPYFQNENAARAKIESVRWPNGPVCGRCGEGARRYATKRPGRFRCGNPACRKDYTVTTGTVMESSHIPLHKWLMAFYLLSASKKGMSSLQLMRSLGVTYKSAWFLSHRVREAMKAGGLAPPMGGEGNIVEADETYHGKRETQVARSRNARKTFTKRGLGGGAQKRIIVSLVERGGSVRSFHVASADRFTLGKIVRENVAKESRLHTDENNIYVEVGKEFVSHETVIHSHKEYVRDDVHVNSAEGFFGLFKRGFNGIYQHCREKHLHRYLAEYDFRYNHRQNLGFNDLARTLSAVKGAEGKRLTYRKANSAIV
ncbi:IS1595 family transposase [Rhodopila sp.]|uniref:IS1595 family transposase n=1 Tax=Rhodopila sp. TaxID=2480087 RepID=UPI003D1208DF